MEQFNKGSQMMQSFMQSSLFILYKIEKRKSPTIKPTPAMRPRILTIECSIETWIVRIGLMGTANRTDHFKLLPGLFPRQRRSFSFGPNHRTLHRARQTNSGLLNCDVLYLSLLHNIGSSDATTSSRCTCLKTCSS